MHTQTQHLLKIHLQKKLRNKTIKKKTSAVTKDISVNCFNYFTTKWKTFAFNLFTKQIL